MKHRIASVFISCVAAAFLVSCLSIPTGSHGGSWETSYGKMVLVQNGSNVSGTYDWATDAHIAGTVSGSRLTFTWWEGAATYAEAPSRGDGYFDLAPTGLAMHGEWKYEGSSEWDGTWDATRF